MTEDQWEYELDTHDPNIMWIAVTTNEAEFSALRSRGCRVLVPWDGAIAVLRILNMDELPEIFSIGHEATRIVREPLCDCEKCRARRYALVK